MPFHGEPLEHGIDLLENDVDVCKLIEHITKKGQDSLMIYVEHNLSVPEEVPLE